MLGYIKSILTFDYIKHGKLENMKAVIIRSEITKETEKAIQFSTEIDATTGHNVNYVTRSFWVPKKCCKVIEGGLAIAEWFFDKSDYPSGIVNSILRNEDNTYQIANI